MNVGERYKSITFTTYPAESKGLVNVVNVIRGFFMLRRTRIAKRMLSARARDMTQRLVTINHFVLD